jgi:hypothetical protein
MFARKMGPHYRVRRLGICTGWMGVFGQMEQLTNMVPTEREGNGVNGKQGGRIDVHGIGVGRIGGPKMILLCWNVSVGSGMFTGKLKRALRRGRV